MSKDCPLEALWVLPNAPVLLMCSETLASAACQPQCTHFARTADMEVHMLLPKDPESERLVQWVEGGECGSKQQLPAPTSHAVTCTRHALQALRKPAQLTGNAGTAAAMFRFTTHLTKCCQPCCAAHHPPPTSPAHHLLRLERQPSLSPMPAPLHPSRLLFTGVAHALERRYLRKVFFGFSRDAAGKDLLEEVGAAGLCWGMRC